MDYSPPGSSVHGILQARILEWVAISFSRGSSQPRDWIQVSRIAGRFFANWDTKETPITRISKSYTICFYDNYALAFCFETDLGLLKCCKNGTNALHPDSHNVNILHFVQL